MNFVKCNQNVILLYYNCNLIFYFAIKITDAFASVILLLFSENNTESYWLDKAEQIICEAIKLCRLYNNGYVTFLELHKLITNPNYYNEKIQILRNLFINSKFSKSQI